MGVKGMGVVGMRLEGMRVERMKMEGTGSVGMTIKGMKVEENESSIAEEGDHEQNKAETHATQYSRNKRIEKAPKSFFSPNLK